MPHPSTLLHPSYADADEELWIASQNFTFRGPLPICNAEGSSRPGRSVNWRSDQPAGMSLMVKTKSTPQKGTTQKESKERTMEAIEAALPRDIGDDLNARQAEFVKQYLFDLNAAQAAIRAGYSAHTAKEIGYQNLRKPRIAMAIESALAEFGGITRTRIVDELGAIAFSDIGEIVTWNEEAHDYGAGDEFVLDGDKHFAKEGITRVIRQKVNLSPSATMRPELRRVIAEVSQTDKGSIKIKLCDKLAALDKLTRALGMYTDNLDVAGKLPATYCSHHLRGASCQLACSRRARSRSSGCSWR
jgi:phage terminase small subunit